MLQKMGAWAALSAFLLLAALISTAATAASSGCYCKPAAWDPNDPSWVPPDFDPCDCGPPPPQPGEINCRWKFKTEIVDDSSCGKIAELEGITPEKFFFLNPGLMKDCSNIQPNTRYCVAGFIEPLRAFDGLCGPKHSNATCVGTDKQCCNAVTWTCGDSFEDCAADTCYEGACPGDKVWSTDGTCGIQHGNRKCSGKWGNCCNIEGHCGSGREFCAPWNCQSGSCIVRKNTFKLPRLIGNSPDGSCGGTVGYTCDAEFGNCCNKDGKCGSRAEDCAEGCQPKFGECGAASVTIRRLSQGV